jgi:CubicO group peptidase (beta-lactamase class C family)
MPDGRHYGPRKENKSLMRLLKPAAFCCFAVIAAAAWAGERPEFSNSGPDAAAYGAAEGYPAGLRAEPPVPQINMVGHYSHFGEKYPSRIAARAETPSAWRRADEELSLTYTYAGASHDLPDYLSRHPATGLLIAHGDTIQFEHYQYARTDRDRFLSQSMAKTIVAMLMGIAVQEGAIKSIDQPAADYVPALAGTEYGKTPIRALLHMASGVAFKEVYDAPGDNQRLNLMLFGRNNPGPAQAVAVFNTREVPPDTRFHYASIETEVLGLVLTQAVKMPLTEYLRAKLWQPMGAEADAAWTIDTTGQEIGYCCINAVLRDWARVGMILANDGAWNGHQIVPRQWVLDATTAQEPFLRPGTMTRFYGYGYQTWLLSGPRRQFALLGIHGQTIFVDPVAKLVLVHTAVRMKASQDPAAVELRALWGALVARFGG